MRNRRFSNLSASVFLQIEFKTHIVYEHQWDGGFVFFAFDKRKLGGVRVSRRPWLSKATPTKTRQSQESTPREDSVTFPPAALPPPRREFIYQVGPNLIVLDADDPLGIGPSPYPPNLYSYLQLLQMDYTRSEPIDIDATRSPGNRPSALTSGLRMQDYSAGGFPLNSNAIDDYRDDLFGNGTDSMNGQGFYGARPIMMHERRRRESNNVDNFSNGMNLAPVSVGSWIRDE
jgi:hypothetical protein